VFIIISLYLFCFALLWWAIFGYIITIYLYSITKSAPNPYQELDDYPTITILVPCYNEEAFVEKKIENLAALDYPRERIEIIFLDGRSTDRTVEKITQAIQHYPHMRANQTGVRGKINQINSVLPEIESDIIVNSDVDGLLHREAIVKTAEEFHADPTVGVVGGLVIPINCLAEEVQYWKTQNQVWILESKAYSSSVVAGLFYAFRRGLLERFPDDVVADDVYLSFEANFKGYRTVYSHRAVVYDTRAATSTAEMFHQKFRRINAYIIEILRFIYSRPKLSFSWKVIFYTRALQILGVPWMMFACFLLTISLLTIKQYEPVLWLMGISVVSFLICHQIVATVKLPQMDPKDNFFLSLKVFCSTMIIIICAAISYPFWRPKYQLWKNQE